MRWTPGTTNNVADAPDIESTAAGVALKDEAQAWLNQLPQDPRQWFDSL